MNCVITDLLSAIIISGVYNNLLLYTPDYTEMHLTCSHEHQFLFEVAK